MKITARARPRPDRHAHREHRKPLPWGRTYFGDLLAQCLSEGYGCRERGILFTLLGVQHLSGSIPADLRAVRRLVGEDASLAEVKVVVAVFFPLTEDGQRRANPQHAEARDAARRAYDGVVRGGQIRAAQRWGA